MLEIKESVVEIKKSRLKHLLLKELYISGPSTVIKISKIVHSSPPSIAMLLNELAEEGWVMEVGVGSSKSGRKPVLYGLNSSHGFVVTWSISKVKGRLVLYNLNHDVYAEKDYNFKLENNNSYAAFIAEKTREFLKEEKIDISRIIGVGICMPGLIDKNTGYNYTHKNKEDKPLNALIEKYLDVPAFTLNDAKAIAFGEKRFGLAKDYNDVLAINIDWGVGLGILLKGEVFNGTAGFAGELGHIQVRPMGELCSCGKTGCLETVTTTEVLIRRVKEEIAKGRVSKILQLSNGEKDTITEDLIIAATHQGDELCIDLFQEIGTELGKALSIAVHLFNPELIIVDGLLARAGKFITIPIEQAINKYCLAEFRDHLKIKTSQLRESAASFGMYAYVMEHIFESGV
ncbi:ROK family protein [Xanthocytophaga agilis]|uniref:ROK family protein n=1 Tax=Xanthocytophaga agilis TaxID=3048010 RepID=A0AAE3UJX1_9BACT|nr:ROK family protein [Xanthocytophaga agilis]MDJ1506702.1 ROK family protein [Xanthocytophaga agilis]